MSVQIVKANHPLAPAMIPFLKKFIPIFLTSLFFETVQFVFAIGASDITDLLANTLGGVIGMGVFFILSKIFKAKVSIKFRLVYPSTVH